MHHLISVAAIVFVCVGCSRTATTLDSSSPEPQRLEAKHLPNAVQIHPKVLSGGLPTGDSAFAELRQLGVQTIISVDGATPDVESAQRFGLRYVHLPHGYDGIPDARVAELAKAVRELPGPIYIHCHHGKHRSPAAASVACIAAGMIAPDDGLAVLKLAGTSPNYRGLFDSTREAHPLDAALLDTLDVDFRATVEVAAMAEAMVTIEHMHDHLRAIEQEGWKPLADHPDIEPAHEALMLREHFTELLRTDEVEAESRDFRQLLEDSETAAERLEQVLRADDVDEQQASRSLAQISGKCTQCHQQFRDVPIGEKRTHKPPR